MSLNIVQMPLGALQTNAYLLTDSASRQAVLIDPSSNAPVLLAEIEKSGCQLVKILATHTHFDHILASGGVKEATGASFWLHEEGLPQYRAAHQRAALFGIPAEGALAEPDGFIAHGEQITVGGITLEARYTPGHSLGHLVFVLASHEVVFVGDCLFYDGIGRTDLPDGNICRLKQSIFEQILTLPDTFQVLSGHGPATTIGREKAHNPYVQMLENLEAD